MGFSKRGGGISRLWSVCEKSISWRIVSFREVTILIERWRLHAGSSCVGGWCPFHYSQPARPIGRVSVPVSSLWLNAQPALKVYDEEDHCLLFSQ